MAAKQSNSWYYCIMQSYSCACPSEFKKTNKKYHCKTVSDHEPGPACDASIVNDLGSLIFNLIRLLTSIKESHPPRISTLSGFTTRTWNGLPVENENMLVSYNKWRKIISIISYFYIFLYFHVFVFRMKMWNFSCETNSGFGPESVSDKGYIQILGFSAQRKKSTW